MTNWLSTGKPFDGVIANNDESAIGAIQAMKAAGIDMKAVVVGGVDATQDALAAMQAGDLDVTVFQDAAGQGAGALDAALKLAKGEAVEQKVYIPFQLVTPANIDDFLEEELRSLVKTAGAALRRRSRSPRLCVAQAKLATAATTAGTRRRRQMAQTTHGVGGLTFDASRRHWPPELNVLFALVLIVAVFELLGRLLIGDSFLFNTRENVDADLQRSSACRSSSCRCRSSASSPSA